MSAVTLPQKAGFVPTVAEWDQLVRIAENLAAQLAQAQASAVETARIVGAERDAARAEVARLKEEVEGAYEAHNEAVTILERRLETHKEAEEAVLKALPAVAINEMEEVWGASNTAIVRKSLAYLWHCAARAALRQPAPAQGQNYYTGYNVPACSECNGTRRVETEEFGRIICPMCKDEPAPAGGEARP